VLPRELTRIIFGLLPADARLRCREVCKPWWAFLEERRLWWFLDLSPRSGVLYPTVAHLWASTKRAGGQLRCLNVSNFEFDGKYCAMLLRVAEENAASLTELRAWCQPLRSHLPEIPFIHEVLMPYKIRGILAAAPRLRLLECDGYLERIIETDPNCALPLLRNEAPFQAVRLQSLTNNWCWSQLPDADVLVPAIASHATLTRLELLGTPLSHAAFDALVQVALSRPFKVLKIEYAADVLSQEEVLLIGRLLREGALQELGLRRNRHLFDGPQRAALCTALRSCKLETLSLRDIDLFDSPNESLDVRDALTGHPTLQTLLLKENVCSEENAPNVGQALGGLIAAESALTWRRRREPAVRSRRRQHDAAHAAALRQ
jgi:hypothetical protein